jgi:hypothetical protein
MVDNDEPGRIDLAIAAAAVAPRTRAARRPKGRQPYVALFGPHESVIAANAPLGVRIIFCGGAA